MTPASEACSSKQIEVQDQKNQSTAWKFTSQKSPFSLSSACEPDPLPWERVNRLITRKFPVAEGSLFTGIHNRSIKTVSSSSLPTTKYAAEFGDVNIEDGKCLDKHSNVSDALREPGHKRETPTSKESPSPLDPNENLAGLSLANNRTPPQSPTLAKSPRPAKDVSWFPSPSLSFGIELEFVIGGDTLLKVAGRADVNIPASDIDLYGYVAKVLRDNGHKAEQYLPR